MKRLPFLFSSLIVASICAFSSSTRADTFGTGNQFQIDFVKIGNPGNPADNTGQPRPAGSVGYEYRIGKYEISRSMVDKANAEGGLGLQMADMTSYGGNGPDKPATGVSWFDAAKFVNWMNTSTGHTPAYKFDGSGEFQLWTPSDLGYDATNLFRNKNAFYFLPSMNEWYKAAFYDPLNNLYYDFATGSNSTPTTVPSGTSAGTIVAQQGEFAGPADINQAGGFSPFGTMAQAGNVAEWEETTMDLKNNSAIQARIIRGGSWDSFPSSTSVSFYAGASPSASANAAGFRVGSVAPEPSVVSLAVIAFLGILSAFRLRQSPSR